MTPWRGFGIEQHTFRRRGTDSARTLRRWPEQDRPRKVGWRGLVEDKGRSLVLRPKHRCLSGALAEKTCRGELLFCASFSPFGHLYPLFSNRPPHGWAQSYEIR